MNKIEPGIGISRRYLHDEVAERMRELIRSGEMEPKARINEGELTERFGISRTPLREAIKILATEGLLELLPNRGARVASISCIALRTRSACAIRTIGSVADFMGTIFLIRV